MERGEKACETAMAVVVASGDEEVEDMEAREDSKGEELRWEKLLPRMPVRVLLVEGDDSTRQIIAALLRKCSYRVAAASDGLKAWDTLKDKHHNIDLVLTEVDLPLISGFGLLTMIMDHDQCKNIPVIMMSSHDSMSIVFKCMLRGAADFLIKPIRKNELRNLWQHVWRRQIVSGFNSTHEIQDICEVTHNLKSHSGRREYTTENVVSVHTNKLSSEQESDAHSSCTRSDMEAESARKKLEIKLPITESASMNQNGPDSQLVGVFNHENADLVHTRPFYCNKINNETQCPKPHLDKTPKDIELFQNDTCKSSLVPHLELPLKRYEEPLSDKKDCEQSSAWNHSSMSAFSQYNRKTVTSTLLQQKNLGSESNGLESTDLLKHQESRINVEETNSPSVGSSAHDGRAVQCNPVRVIPVSFPDTSLRMFYSQSGQQTLWSSSSPILLEAAKPTNSSRQENLNPVQADTNEKNGISSSCSLAEKKDETMEHDEQRHVPSAVGESGGSSTCNSSINNLNGSECASGIAGVGDIRTMNVSWPINDECKDGTKPADCQRLTQREIALTKFRLKRKERCFEKKVRYQSRKLLAEQRPRVKGQFVRQEKIKPQPVLVGAFQCNSAAR
ncbi:two-component response regulator-like PRR95 isoform X2 [Zingiber officinale]|uniref:two-component response regulator-like PRR95 isoform X2 n=1 Tax=Zingiber officinale TaxID=94328 RepID=UPI001C4D5A09|nr:two-component response regulator-like PRR95 isoform X2 [Zingiber officinale]